MPQKKTLGIILLTQSRQGECLLEAAQHFLGEPLQQVIDIPLLGNENCGEMTSRLRRTITALRQTVDGVLILCDLFGSTHANIACEISTDDKKIACVSGLNLAMLMEAYTRRCQPLKNVATKVAEMGRESVVQSS
ncbi:hypothetical protein NQX30_06635 [Candidatus Persebacteraceae bacterium Df01]|jgi:mannose/fructose-specific phosphotransferase system component IIA|uniref:PTS EIIA type-4 domain-containing protein n=1 Tax=Candidatus Doriopsillibacter californiensis TaxID=2970740 RepID=A0ABT7QMU6_9GAMM|nr:hypothetical protein [Candidatus Persebacteraceae bacterium Df01]